MADEHDTDTVNQKLLNIIDTKHQFMLSNLSRVAASSRRGVPPWQIENAFESMIQDVLSIESRSGASSTGLLATLQGLVKPDAPVKDDTMDKISKSLHALHKRNDTIDDILGKVMDKLEMK
jgi:hypothetical protein